MLDKQQARNIATNYIDQMTKPPTLIGIMDSNTLELPYGWVFFYQTRLYIETGNPADGLVGNAPIMIEKDGTLHTFGTAKPMSVYLQEFEENRRIKKI